MREKGQGRGGERKGGEGKGEITGGRDEKDEGERGVAITQLNMNLMYIYISHSLFIKYMMT